MASTNNAQGISPYSTLEPVHPEQQVAERADNVYPQLAPAEYNPYSPQTVVDASGKESVNHPATPYSQHLSPYTGKSVNDESEVGHDQPQEKRKTICGLSRRIFYIVLVVVVIVIIAAVAGGVAGGLTANRHNAGNSASNANVLAVSRITASNWTDPDGHTRRTVYFQDVNNAIISRRWDSQNQTWTTSNLTQFVKLSGAIDPLPGTPLAATSTDVRGNKATLYERMLFYLDSNNYVNGLKAASLTDKWNAATTPRHQTRVGSELATQWNRCALENCVGQWIMAFQGPGGNIRIANASDWDNPATAVDTVNVADNTSLALLPRLQGTFVSGLNLISQRTFSDTSGSLQMMTYYQSWNRGKFTEVLSDVPVPSPSQQLAATSLSNWTQPVVFVLLANGTVIGSRWEADQFSRFPSTTFSPEPEKPFSAIATTLDAMFYGISNDEVVEYAVDGSDPSKLTRVGRVYP